MCITGGDGYDARQMMEKSAVFSMPIALGVANSQSNYVAMPQLYKSLLYWWTPDDMFMALDPQELVYPAHNAFEWSQLQVYHTAARESNLAKLISYDLERLAPDIVKLLQGSAFDVPVVNFMMGAMNLGKSRKAAACAWLNSNTETWRHCRHRNMSSQTQLESPQKQQSARILFQLRKV